MELTEQITMVLLVFALLGGLLWVLKRRGMIGLRLSPRRGGSARRLEVIERLPLSPQHAVHLVRVADRVVLIGTAPSGCAILDASAVLDPQSPASGLSQKPS